MAKKILGLIVFVLFLVLLVPAVEATCICPSTGDWSIDSGDTCSNTSETIIVNGSLLVNGTLTFNDVTLNVTGNISIFDNGNFNFTNSSNNFVNESFEPVLKGYSNSNFYARNVTFDVNNTTMGYAMKFQNSTTQIYDSTINHVRSNNSDPAGPALGLFFNGDSTMAAVRNTTITNAKNVSLTVANGANHNLNNLTLSNSPNCILSANTYTNLYNSTLSGCTENQIWLANHGNMTTHGTYINNSNITISAGSTSSLSVKYYFQIYVNTTGETSVPVSDAIVNISRSPAQGGYSPFENSTNSNGLVSDELQQAENHSGSGGGKYFNFNVTVNKSTGGYMYSNSTIFNISSNKVGSDAINVQLDYPAPNVAFEANNSSLNIPLQDSQVIKLWLNNTGNKISNVSLTDNCTSDWAFSYYSENTSFDSSTKIFDNLSVFDNETIHLRIEPPTDAIIGKTYTFNITANATAHNSSGIYNSTTFQINITVNPPIDQAVAVQDGLDFLRGTQDSDGSWNSSNFTTAWALWSLNTTYNYSFTECNKTLHYFNDTQHSSGYWNDPTYGIELTTAMTVIAHYESGYTNSTAPADLTAAAEYLQANVNSSEVVPDTPLALTAIYKSGINTNGSTSDALTWLKDNQSSNGSWGGNDAGATALGLWALSSAGDNSDNRSNAREWLRNNLELNGHFSDSMDEEGHALAIIALLEDDYSQTWIVDRDQNSSTKNDQYDGSIQRAINWLLDQQEGNGGWGNSPASNKTTAAALSALSTSGSSSVSGQITGTGNATGYDIANQTVQFAGSDTYTTTTNGTGHYVINLPADDYTISLNSNIYYLNDTYYANLSSGQNMTLDMGALPKINLSGNYGERYFNDSNIDAGTDFRINGTAVYAHDGSPVNGTMYYTSDNSNAINGGPVSTNTSTGRFTTDKSAPSPDSTTTYTLTIWVNDTYGSNASTTGELAVQGTDSSDDGDTAASNGGGGGGSSNYGILITEYNKQMTLSQGETTTTKLVAKNSGIYSLDKVALEIVGIEDSWYSATVEGSGSTSEDLDSEEVVTYSIEFTIPNDAESKVYPATWRVKDSGGNAMAEKNTNITISEVWTETTISGLNSTIETLEGNFSEITEKVNELKKKGNATGLEDALAEINESIQEAKTKYSEGDYTGAQDAIDRANELIADLEADLDELETIPFEGISFGKLGIAIFIIIIAVIAGILVWYKFMRLVPISEIKRYPDRFLEGARLEGVVKGVTDTKKGKVFMVKDHTGKIHVRYPYYTTVEEGNMIRAQGVVKTYKGTAYMDATDIHRVAVTGKHHGDPLTKLKKKLHSIKRKLKK